MPKLHTHPCEIAPNQFAKVIIGAPDTAHLQIRFSDLIHFYPTLQEFSLVKPANDRVYIVEVIEALANCSEDSLVFDLRKRLQEYIHLKDNLSQKAIMHTRYCQPQKFALLPFTDHICNRQHAESQMPLLIFHEQCQQQLGPLWLNSLDKDSFSITTSKGFTSDNLIVCALKHILDHGPLDVNIMSLLNASLYWVCFHTPFTPSTDKQCSKCGPSVGVPMRINFVQLFQNDTEFFDFNSEVNALLDKLNKAKNNKRTLPSDQPTQKQAKTLVDSPNMSLTETTTTIATNQQTLEKPSQSQTSNPTIKTTQVVKTLEKPSQSSLVKRTSVGAKPSVTSHVFSSMLTPLLGAKPKPQHLLAVLAKVREIKEKEPTWFE